MDGSCRITLRQQAFSSDTSMRLDADWRNEQMLWVFVAVSKGATPPARFVLHFYRRQTTTTYTPADHAHCSRPPRFVCRIVTPRLLASILPAFPHPAGKAGSVETPHAAASRRPRGMRLSLGAPGLCDGRLARSLACLHGNGEEETSFGNCLSESLVR